MSDYPKVDDDDLLYKLFLKREFQLNRNYDIDMNNLEKIKDYRDKSCNKTSSVTSTPKDHQNITAHFLNPNTPYSGLLLFHGTGSGKCHAKDTPIVLYDGRIKMVQDIIEGDLLMGDDSTPRVVLSLACGQDKMYDVVSDKGDTYTVNQEHILCLKASGYPQIRETNNSFDVQYLDNNEFKSKIFIYSSSVESNVSQRQEAELFCKTIINEQILELTVKDFLNLPDDKKSILKGYRVPIEFPEKKLVVDPYLVGYWLGSLNNDVPPIFSHIFQADQKKYIPLLYKCNSRENRLNLLGGLIDGSRGCYNNGEYELNYQGMNNTDLIEDIIFVCRSLGFGCFRTKKSENLYLSVVGGRDIKKIPTTNPKSRVGIENDSQDNKHDKYSLLYDIKVNLRGHGSYYGFVLNGNSRYILGDFTVTHNTCASIQIAETFKSQVEKYNTKIFVLVPGPILKKQFKNEIILNCTDVYLSKKEYMNASPDERKKMYNNALFKLSSYYSILSYKSFYKRVLGEKIRLKSNSRKKYLKDKDGVIERDLSSNRILNLNNTLLIIDEAHHFTGYNNEYGKAIQLIKQKSYNLKILLLTATPMQNLPSSIIDILNFLRPHDSQISESDFFNGTDYNMKLKKEGHSLLAKYINGYVSYFKGNDPYLFATKNEIGEVPRFLKFTKLVRCYMKDFQLNTYNKFKNMEDDSLGKSYQSIANFVFPLIDEKNNITGVFGEDGLTKIKNILTNNRYKYYNFIKKKFKTKNNNYSILIDENLNIDGDIFHKEYLPFFSIKFYSALTNILENKLGLIFVYSNFVRSGVNLFTKVLRRNGFVEYGSTSIEDETLDYNLTITYKEWKSKKKDQEEKFYPAVFISLTGADNLLHESISEEKVSTIFNVFNGEENKNGKNIKLIIGSKVINEGITIANITDIHILDTWYTLGLIEQVIGRGIRDCKHYNLMNDKNFYPIVNIYKYAISIHNDKEISKEEELYKKAEIKYINIKQVERLLIENSIDCPLNYNLNRDKRYLEKHKNCIALSDNKTDADVSVPLNKKNNICPSYCQFMDCDYTCNNIKLNRKYYNKNRKIYDIVNLNNIDNSTYYQTIIDIEINKCILEIKKMYIFSTTYSYQEIHDEVKSSYEVNKQYMFDEFYLQIALNKLSPFTKTDFIYFTNFVYNINRQPGYLAIQNNKFIFKLFKENVFLDNLKLESNRNLLSVYLNSTKKSKAKTKLYDYNNTKYYYSNREENEYVGIIFHNDIFNLRKKRKVNKKYREVGLSTENGGNCITSFSKEELDSIVRKYKVPFNKNTKNDLCYHIMKTFLHLEKTNKDNITYMVVPSNHPIYVFPYNIYSRKEYLENIFNKKIKLTDKYFEVVLVDEEVIQSENTLKRYSFIKDNNKKNVWISMI